MIQSMQDKTAAQLTCLTAEGSMVELSAGDEVVNWGSEENAVNPLRKVDEYLENWAMLKVVKTGHRGKMRP